MEGVKMGFRKYQHIERFGNDEVQGIELGISYIFPKIDGTNGSVWLKDGELKAGSRKRVLSLDDDNAGFYAYVLDQVWLKGYLEKHPTHRLFGEWLVPHSLKTYRMDAWKRFYVFDVCLDKDEEELEYIPYDIYKPLLDNFGLDYIPPLGIISNGTYEYFIKALENNGFLIDDGKGTGEGIVIKNYDYYNKYGRQTWAKIVTNEFKEKHHKEMGAPLITASRMVEEAIVEEFCTPALIDKEYAKIVTEKEGWRSEYIPMLLGKVYYELVNEEIWNAVKKLKQPTVNFKTLNMLTINKIKRVKSDMF
jgi:Fe-S cluster biosynthesis and repair protein YggX